MEKKFIIIPGSNARKMNMNKIKLLFPAFLLFCTTSCALFYPPDYYNKLVNSQSASSEGKGASSAWNKYSVPAPGTLSCVVMTNDGCIVAGDSAGYVVGTSDGGNSWSSSSMGSAVTSLYHKAPYFLVATVNSLTVYSGGSGSVPSGGSVEMHDLQYNGGYYFAAGNGGNGFIFYNNSADPTQPWYTASISGSVYDVCYFSGTGQLFAVDDTGIYCGTTGTWNQAANLWAFTRIASSGTTMVAAGGGVMDYSSDGNNWNITSYGTTEVLNKIIWVPELNKFIAAGQNGTVIASTDGSNWSVMPGLSFAAGENVIDICSYNGRLVLITSLNNLYISP